VLLPSEQQKLNLVVPKELSYISFAPEFIASEPNENSSPKYSFHHIAEPDSYLLVDSEAHILSPPFLKNNMMANTIDKYFKSLYWYQFNRKALKDYCKNHNGTGLTVKRITLNSCINDREIFRKDYSPELEIVLSPELMFQLPTSEFHFDMEWGNEEWYCYYLNFSSDGEVTQLPEDRPLIVTKFKPLQDFTVEFQEHYPCKKIPGAKMLEETWFLVAFRRQHCDLDYFVHPSPARLIEPASSKLDKRRTGFKIKPKRKGNQEPSDKPFVACIVIKPAINA